MELEKRALEQIVYDDEIPDPEEDTISSEVGAGTLLKAAARRTVPADEAMTGED